MQRTKLFQQAGSPLIQGLSRTRRPLWQEWLIAVVVSAPLTTALLAALLRAPSVPPGSFVAVAVFWATFGLLVVVPAGCVVGGFVTALAVGYGARRAWLAGASAATVVTVAGAVLFFDPVAAFVAGLW